MISCAYGKFTKDEKIMYLVMMSKEMDLTVEPVEEDPEIFNLSEVYYKSNKARKKTHEEMKSFESGNRPPKYDWELDEKIKFIPQGSINTRKEAEAFLESIGSNKDY
jgi:hypothetical protein